MLRVLQYCLYLHRDCKLLRRCHILLQQSQHILCRRKEYVIHCLVIRHISLLFQYVLDIFCIHFAHHNI